MHLAIAVIQKGITAQFCVDKVVRSFAQGMKKPLTGKLVDTLNVVVFFIAPYVGCIKQCGYHLGVERERERETEGKRERERERGRERVQLFAVVLIVVSHC